MPLPNALPNSGHDRLGDSAAISQPRNQRPSRPANRPTSLACLECRQKHLKCDGVTPTCGRCNSRGLNCDFTPSRRGRARSAKQLSNVRKIVRHSSTVFTENVQAFTPNSFDLSPRTLQLHSVPAPQLPTPQGDQSSLDWIDDEALVNLFYVNFHLAHPILLPRSLYADRKYASCLRSVVEYIGSYFAQGIPSTHRDALRQRVLDQLAAANESRVDSVQARLLFAIAAFASDDAQTGEENLSQAIKIALRLGMHKNDFAVTHGRNEAVEGESLRRTWYELFIIETCVAALQRRSPVDTTSARADVALPCEESAYESGIIPGSPASWYDFENQAFADTDTCFSSFSYRINAAHILGQVLSITGPQGVHRDEVQTLDNTLASWSLHLPATKAETEIVDTYGNFDMIMYQAHILINYATILLHFSRGDLHSSALPSAIVPGGHGIKSFCPCNRQSLHSVKAVDAAKQISVLAAFRSPASVHSPFYVYPLALCALVQLAACRSHMRRSDRCFEQHRARISLALGTLKSLGKYWAVANSIRLALKLRASAMLLRLNHDSQTGRVRANAEPTDTDPLASFNNVYFDGLDFQGLEDFAGLDPNALCL